MSSHTRAERLRTLARQLTDPVQRALAERLASLHELDERRRSQPPGPERDRLDDEIVRYVDRILHPPSGDADPGDAESGRDDPRSP